MTTPPRGRRKTSGAQASTKGASTAQYQKEEGSDKTLSAFSLAFPVIGIGASAGGLSAVTELLKHFSPTVAVAIVIIQHLDPKHGSLTRDILSRVSPMPVHEVKEGMQIQPGHVYVIPPNRSLRLVHGVLRLSPRSETRGQHLPIDLFFRSLAEDRKDRAIGVVLSGIASDGTMGVQAIKAEGGFTFAQDPLSAQYDGMPRSAILSGAVDIVDTPAGIAREVAKMCSLFSTRRAAPRAVELMAPRGPNGALRKIFALVRSAAGVDFTHYKHSTIQRRITRRLLLLKIDDLESYASYLGTHPEEAQALLADILIHVTSFFRDPAAYEALKTGVLPKYMENWDPGVPFRVWVPGCSSGEEAYSIAIAFFEFLDKAKVRAPLQIFASDISDLSIQKARAAIYPESIAKDVSKARLNRFFEKMEGGGYRIAKWIRDTCLFSKHDITADPPFAKIDLISCRNVLIYFTSDLQKRVVPILHYALNPGGILWLGRSETISGFGSLFAMEDRTNKFYSKKTTATPVRLQFPISGRIPESLATRKSPNLTGTLQDVQVEADRVAIEQYAPPGVVINDSAEILQVRGRPLPYVELAPGQASLNLFKLAHPEVVSDLRYLINAARKQHTVAARSGLTLKENGARRHFGITVVPFRLASPSKEHYFSIFFEESLRSARPEPSPPARRSRGRPSEKSKRRAEQRQQQMLEDRKYQHDLIEEYETAQEELISSNEELQSTNEELQSTNEELETAKEELQSANEEMTTINEELQTRNAEITQLANDLTNLLASMDMPIVMVGPDAKIRRLTPKATPVLNVIPSDIGRSIGDIRPGIQAPHLGDLVEEVMGSLSVKELETQDKEGVWYRLQVRPYRTADNRIDGAVIALTDISDLKRSAHALKVAHDDAKIIIESTPVPMLVIAADRRIQMANASFYKLFQVEPSETEGKFLFELGDAQWNIPSLLTMVEAVLNQGVSFHDFEVEHDFPRIGHKYMVLQASSASLTGANGAAALLAIEDFTARREIADQLRQAEEKYRHLLENAHDGIIIVNEKGIIEFANRQVETTFGYSPGELANQSYEILIPEQYREVHREHYAAFMRKPEARDMGSGVDLYGKRKDGTVFAVEISLSPIKVDSKVMVTAIIRDISERKKLERERQDLLARETDARHQAERASQVKDEFLATLSHELRTPLATILSWAQVIRMAKPDVGKAQQAMAMIEKSAKDQSQLIDDLLDVSRIQAGKLLLELRELQAAECVVAALDSVRHSAEEKSITIETAFDPSACPVMADSGRLEQVFRNLLTNAIKFTPPGGKITVRSERKSDPERLEIAVEDTGKGINPEFLPYLFTRFMQEDSSAKRVFGGLGLGLSIVKKLVEMHEGTVTAYSAGQGKGAVFTVTLPCARHSPPDSGGRMAFQLHQGTDERPTAPADLRGLRVLVIDDMEDARDVFSVMLESTGASVETAASAEAGLSALHEFKPDVVLCDIAMPGEDGLSFIRKVRALAPDQGGRTPAIAVTAYAGPEKARQALDSGFDAHLAKPVDAVDLTCLIAKLAGP